MSGAEPEQATTAAQAAAAAAEAPAPELRQMSPLNPVLALRLTRAQGAAALALVCWLYWGLPAPFCYHPVGMTLAFTVLMTEGVLVGHKAVCLPLGAERLRLLKRHMWIQLGATAAALVGFWAIYRNKDLHNKEHFTSTHSKIGLVAITMLIFAPVMGALSFRYLGLLGRLPEHMHGPLKAWHSALGQMVYVCGIVAACFGICSPSMDRQVYTKILFGCTLGALCIASMLFAGIRPGKSPDALLTE
eukprot:TRINITY_DN4602_c0_g2_i1.p1 TRINITY_DN4602_c0_g2~~TRINITY_DN4602_c0_g2_i1.p1  ORF type:complete len:246 (+),score=54.45 TRINITY_DN4602_c0_g2_i1:63-800(+)